MTSHFAPKSSFPLDPIPTHARPLKLPVFPHNLSDLNVGELVALYTAYTNAVAYSAVKTAELEARYVAKQHEADTEITLRFVHDESRSTTERKERAKASRKVIGLTSDANLLHQDLIVLRAVTEGYRTKLFAIKHELERRKHE